MKILQNATRHEDDRILLSTTKDTITHKELSISGGKFFLNRAGSDKYTELSITDESTVSDLISNLVWGTYGNVGKADRTPENFQYKRLSDMESEHLESIHKQKSSSTLHKWVIEEILKDRRYWPKRFKK